MISVFSLIPWRQLRRLGWLGLPISFSLVALLASQILPNPTGVGTHQALGLPPCPFFYITGFKCPGCGLTTSFSCLMHLQWINAFRAHPLGPLIFLLLALLSVFSLLEFTNYPTPLRKLLEGHYSGLVQTSVGAYVAVWVLRMFWQFLAS